MKKVKLNEYKHILVHYNKIIYSKKFSELSRIFKTASIKKKKIFFCGNGGSAANSNHASVDLNNHFRKKNIRNHSILSFFNINLLPYIIGFYFLSLVVLYYKELSQKTSNNFYNIFTKANKYERIIYES